VLGHGVVDGTSGEDDLGVVAELLGLVDEVIGVDGDAVAANQTRREPDEVPLGRGGVDDCPGVESHLVEYDGELVEECDVQVPLDVLDDFRGLCSPDVFSDVDVGDQAVELGKGLRGCFVHAGDDLGDLVDGVLLVAGVDAFGGVADRKVPPALHPGLAFEDGNHDLLGEAGPDSGLADDDGAFLQVSPDSGGGIDNGSEVRLLVPSDGGGDADDDDVGFLYSFRVSGGKKVTPHGLIECVHRLLVPAVPNHLQVSCECLGEGKADVAEADDADGHVFDLFLFRG